jgi:hypothetical protein
MTSYNTLIHTFERIHFFLQRLKCYTEMPLSMEFTELLGKIMAQILSILALSTKAMTERRMNVLIDAVCSFLAGYLSEKFLKWLMGKTDVEAAGAELLRLDFLTREESLMVAVRNLEVMHRVDGKVDAIKVLAEDIDKKLPGLLLLVGTVVDRLTTKADTLTGNQLQEKLRTWLSPPDPSINHDTACKAQHTGTARWFIQGSTFRDWKEKGSLLWIRGNRTLLPPTLFVWRLTPLLIPQPVWVRASSGTRFFVCLQ